ncbi:MAG TPA: CorA family divalent cation transporter, partial [Flavitalea sp.]|nr:CorA family divalent cation transporter [Flavitalea sp.]
MYRPSKQFPFISLNSIFRVGRTKEILHVNPTVPSSREDANEVTVTVFDYSADFLEESQSHSVKGCQRFTNNEHITWINVDGLCKKDVESLASQFGIHSLLVEDILSINQRPKMDEIDGVLFCLLNMLYFNKENKTVEAEQVSIVLGKDFVISFQEDPTRDVFDPI